jgi:hypothetical protein
MRKQKAAVQPAPEQVPPPPPSAPTTTVSPRAKEALGIPVDSVRFIRQVDLGGNYDEQIRMSKPIDAREYKLELIGALLHVTRTRSGKRTRILVPLANIAWMMLREESAPDSR